MSSKLHVFIPYGKFDKSKLHLCDAKIKKSKKGNETCESIFTYDLPNGKKATDIYFIIPKKETFGIFPSYPFGLEKQSQTPEAVNGYQVTYPMTSQDTMKSPTEEEQYVFDLLDCFFDLAWGKLEEECDKDADDRVVPAVTYNSYLGSKDKKGNFNKSYSIKPLYEYPNKPIEKGEKNKKREKDFSKPQRTYLKLNTFGEGKDLKCYTKIYGPGNKIIHPLKYSGVKTNMEIVIQLNRVFWGAHGKSTHGGSINIRISEMNVTPISQEHHRFLAPNTAPEEDDQEEDTTFLSPFQTNSDNNDEFLKDEGKDEENILKEDTSENLMDDLQISDEDIKHTKKKSISDKKKKSKSNK